MPRAQPRRERLSRAIEDRWVTLRRHCADEPSRLRLGRLLHRISCDDPGVQESALAELELATQLVCAGVRLSFLPESRARTADLECHLGHERFFVEVTAMVGSAARRRIPLRGVAEADGQREEESRGTILTHRILARVQQKAKQLADYCDPVILQISIPHADLTGRSDGRREETWLDVKTLSGAVTVLLTKLPHLSAVLIALWDVEPLPSKAGTRLANVEVVERARHQRAVPRVKVLVRNPRADVPLTERQVEALREIL
ncbi:MAG: hypothetical protein NNA21_09650 [Nitrospira sp.]|nr:hypothetical protein [Nitrospira sp.]MCP9462156.1 hypothetical protein [Nitrospira sp.]MCP9474315.1 hypothetical protein [Nitrospira sp.]